MDELILLLSTVAASLAGTHATYYLTHRVRMGSVRAASLSSLVFVGLAHALREPHLLALQPAFFGSTYVAMSEPHRLSESRVMLAGALFAMILFVLQKLNLTQFDGGLGGTLGGTAFLACLLVYWFEIFIQKLASRF